MKDTTIEQSMGEAIEAAKGMTFEKYWAMLMEDRKQLEEYKAESKRLWEETHKTVAELSKNIGGINNTLGELTEASLGIELRKKFDALGFSFTKNGHRTEFAKDGRKIAEVDYFLENGKYVLPVEVKTKLTDKDVIRHLERIEIIRDYMDARNDKRKIMGAVAGGVIGDAVLKQAQAEGLYVLAPSGESIAIVPSPDGFIAREW